MISLCASAFAQIYMYLQENAKAKTDNTHLHENAINMYRNKNVDVFFLNMRYHSSIYVYILLLCMFYTH